MLTKSHQDCALLRTWNATPPSPKRDKKGYGIWTLLMSHSILQVFTLITHFGKHSFCVEYISRNVSDVVIRSGSLYTDL